MVPDLTTCINSCSFAVGPFIFVLYLFRLHHVTFRFDQVGDLNFVCPKFCQVDILNMKGLSLLCMLLCTLVDHGESALRKRDLGVRGKCQIECLVFPTEFASHSKNSGFRLSHCHNETHTCDRQLNFYQTITAFIFVIFGQ